MKVRKNVISGQCYGALVCIQVRYTAIFMGQDWIPKGWQGLKFGVFAPAHNPKIGYRCVAFYGSLLPAMPDSFYLWPKWYKWIYRQMKFKRILSKDFF